MPVQIGGSKAWKVRQHGDIGVSFQWVNDEPAMIVFPARRALAGAGAFVLALSAAHKYADSSSGAPTPYLIEMAGRAATQMGFSPFDSFAVRKIADVIVDSLPDLVGMPPEPQQFTEKQTQTIGEMTIKSNDRTIVEREITALDAEELAAV